MRRDLTELNNGEKNREVTGYNATMFRGKGPPSSIKSCPTKEKEQG